MYHDIFRDLKYINVSVPKTYKEVVTYIFMRILKEKSREYNGKAYYKYKVNLPEKVIKEAGFEEGDDLKVEVRKGEVRLRR